MIIFAQNNQSSNIKTMNEFLPQLKKLSPIATNKNSKSMRGEEGTPISGLAIELDDLEKEFWIGML